MFYFYDRENRCHRSGGTFQADRNQVHTTYYEDYEVFYWNAVNDVDHIIGGKGNTYWYIISKKGKATESYIATCQDGIWSDRLTKGKGSKKTTKEIPGGSTIKLISEKAYLMQEEKWVKGRKPRLVEDSHPHFHYVYGFGDKGVDVSRQYGVTIGFSDIKDLAAGFHLRYLYTGSEVDLP